MTSVPTWQSVKGCLIHRCVLAPAGKWLSIRAALRLDPGANPREPHFVAEARWMAQELDRALKTDDQRMAWALIDSGGPRWTGLYDDFVSLRAPRDRRRALHRLEELSVIAATALLDEARASRWTNILSEAVDPYAMLGATTDEELRAANERVDLLVHRHSLPPVIVDLKTGAELPDVDVMVRRIARKYGRAASEVLETSVECRALGMAFNGEYRWSEPKLVRPDIITA